MEKQVLCGYMSVLHVGSSSARVDRDKETWYCMYFSCFHVLDDSNIIHNCPVTCVRQLKAFLSMCVDIGVPVSLEKTSCPLQTITYLGYELDSCKMECRLPHDKIVKCIDKINFAKTQKSKTLTQLQSLIGLLNFACNVVLQSEHSIGD